MPEIKHSLRDLSAQIEAVGRAHPAWSQAHRVVYHCTEYLNTLARIAEINQDDARPVQLLEFSYVNYKGIVGTRRVNPLSVRWGTSEWYSSPQWLLMCWDLDKQDRREFALLGMSDIKQVDRPYWQGG